MHFSLILKISTIFSTFNKIVHLLRFHSLVPCLSLPCKRPRMNQGRTKELPKNSHSQKVLIFNNLTMFLGKSMRNIQGGIGVVMMKIEAREMNRIVITY